MTLIACSVCTNLDRTIGRELRRNERRRRDGKPVDLTVIDRAKADQRACAESGHWHRTPAVADTG
jgi:hypothetical protein